MAKGLRPFCLALTFRMPLWTAALSLLLAALGIALLREKAAGERAQLLALQAEVRRLSLELEAERSRSQVYSAEVAQLQQSLAILERELNRLRTRAGLPEVYLKLTRLTPPPSEAPRGAGEPAKLGELLLDLKNQVISLSLELEATAQSLDNPLPPDPWPRQGAAHKRPTTLDRTPSGLPLPFEARLTSGFGYRPSPFGNLAYEFHNGVDLAAPEGTPVYATAAGTASEVGWNPLFGLMVLLDHGNGLHTLYGHLSASYVGRGEQVSQGQPIGAVGSTGRSTGPHLHYSVYRYGVAVDPLPYLTSRR
ncbi:MAG: peptidoglycan DD-metalloendopeptidase family protein [Meiothermus sp.]|uniref:peptidoglycan DD-metalloendopeptidase family protein n=2 Tax=Meiothermus sp. TaxID=1955249 RepID=UPI0025DC7359|nr:peptidoglycan DD-metalloendopeptidase family protein [Meiothermus sp.]MCS7194405.1 peptidoglycan DD-metalloendopeptidase family protein [Meiothermus sp.]MCX7740573.1 peptidoglycan DD-metalloendopeptidase family protein [Meiothermus sp.]MDW8089886.1 peptidoglycan DD-metalloendopeptidase family protein [Meiothermus sp.]MDW8481687.1 peptidoglycan DD-metalloendopeptidase family protein [Meiothermus sp.]